MRELTLVAVTDTSGGVTGAAGRVTYQALTEDELDRLYLLQGEYSHIGRDFEVDPLGPVQVPSMEDA